MKKTSLRLTLALLLAVSALGVVGARRAYACSCVCSPYGDGNCAFSCEGCSVRQLMDILPGCCSG
jgi:hypothetical protein